MGKVFEKQIKAIQDQGQVKTIKKIFLWCWRYSIYLKTKETFNEPGDEMREKITDSDKKKLIAMIYYTDTRVILLI